jgi:Fe-S-cluster containining protein
MPTDKKEKQCANECKNGWCCHWEFFVDSAGRYDKEAIALNELKGIRIFKDPRSPICVIVAVPVTCRAMSPTGCSLGDDRPDLCKEFPTEGHTNWVMSKNCVYYEDKNHWAFEDMEYYNPEE